MECHRRKTLRSLETTSIESTVYTEENFPGEYRKYRLIRQFLENNHRDLFYPHCYESAGKKRGPKCVCLAELFTGGTAEKKTEGKVLGGQKANNRAVVLNVELRKSTCKVLPFPKICRMLTEFQKMTWDRDGYIERKDVLYFMGILSPFKSGSNIDWWKLRNFERKPAICSDALKLLFGEAMVKFNEKAMGLSVNSGNNGAKKRKRCTHKLPLSGGLWKNGNDDDQPIVPTQVNSNYNGAYEMINHRYRSNKPLCDLLLSYVVLWEENADLVSDLVGGFTHKYIERGEVIEKYNRMFGCLMDTSKNTVSNYISTLTTYFLKKALVVVASHKFSGKEVQYGLDHMTENGRVLFLKLQRAYQIGAGAWELHDMDGYSIETSPESLQKLLEIFHGNYDDDGRREGQDLGDPFPYLSWVR